MFRTVIIALLLCLSSVSVLSAQKVETEETPESDLYNRTLYRDIKTASYYELITWCRDLELEEQGDSDSLKSQLFNYYKINTEDVKQESQSNATVVKIVSADSTEYYTVDEIGEDYVRISGRVKLIVSQPVKNITHTIEADSVTFNKTTNSMTAQGDVVYIKEENGKEEEYKGDSFTFNVQSWKGVILQGEFKKTQDVDDSEMEFIFSGNSIRKGEGDIVVLEDGSISSCDAEDKHYQIKAQKIWILGPDEWAILSGVLYIGHVPVLYIPFYHLPGNDLFFNPAMGSDTRNGYFIQTTSYLLGRKDSADSDDSIFINIADSDESYILVPQGLYLFKEKGEEENSSTDFVKFKLDYYSRLGGYTGIEGSFSELWKFKSFNFDFGLAVTKSIKEPESNVNDDYSNYFSENNFDAEWNSSTLFGLILPFRWGLSFDFSFSTFSLEFSYLTDPWFVSDFEEREENFDWLNYLMAQTTDDGDDEDSDAESSLTWGLTGSLNIPNEWADDYVNNLSFNSIKMNIEWDTKANSSSGSSYDPNREFFYPESITFPQTTLNMSGVFLDYSSTESFVDSEEESLDSSDPGLRSPWSDGEDTTRSSSDENKPGTIKSPDKMDDIEVQFDDVFFSTKISYDLTGYFNYISYTDSDNWTEPGDIDFSSEESTFTNNNTFNLNYALNFVNSIVTVSGQNSFSTNYLEYFGDVSSDEEIKEKENQELNWENDFSLNIYPLKKVDLMSSSSISYTFNADLYTREYNSTDKVMEDLWIKWDDDYISSHKTALNLNFTIPLLTFSVSFDSTLPPVDIEQSINPKLSISFYNWTNSVKTSAVYSDDVWKMEPLDFTSVYKPIDDISISQQLTYSFEDETLSASISKLQLWGFSAIYNMAYTTDYDWDSGTETLNDNGYAFVPSSVALSYSYDYESPLLWKNRISMDVSVSTTFNMNLQQYNISSLSFDLGYNLHINEFLDFKFSLKSSNNHMFLYFPTLRDYYNITEDYYFFEDLFKSFNIFSTDQKDRFDSFFNMDSISFSLVHKLHDWDLEVSYNGAPIIESDSGDYSTSWDSTVTILVRWNPIEKFKIQVDRKDDEWNADTEID